MKYLCISVHLMSPFWHGRNVLSEAADGAEYPPSPMRLFKAIVAWAYYGAYAFDRPEQKRRALEWLESLPPPIIVAPQAHQLRGYVSFVLANNTDAITRKTDIASITKREDLRRTKLHRPIWMGEKAVLHYLWELRDDNDSRLEDLKREVQRVVVFGRSIDIVTTELAVVSLSQLQQLAGYVWYLPVSAAYLGGITLQVPRPGTLAGLIELHQQKMNYPSTLRLPDAPLLPARHVTYVRQTRAPSVSALSKFVLATPPPPRRFAAFRIVSADGEHSISVVALAHTDVVTAAAMVRHAAIMEARQQDKDDFPGGWQHFVAGHTKHDGQTPWPIRLSYLPLPTVKIRRADGRIRHVLIAEPPGFDGRWARWAFLNLHLKELFAHAEHAQDRRVVARLDALLSYDIMEDSVIRAYTKASTLWVSVTPVVLPGYDDGNPRKAERLLWRALRDAGISEVMVESLEFSKMPFVRVAARVGAYFVPRHFCGYGRWHVLLRLNQPVQGPLAIGLGRHMGLGLMYAPASTELRSHALNAKRLASAPSAVSFWGAEKPDEQHLERPNE